MRPQVGGGFEVKIAEDREAGGPGRAPQWEYGSGVDGGIQLTKPVAGHYLVDLFHNDYLP
jgi:hypothetical protein